MRRVPVARRRNANTGNAKKTTGLHLVVQSMSARSNPKTYQRKKMFLQLNETARVV